MNDLSSLLAILLRIFLLWLVALIAVWVLFPEARSIAAGLVLGSSVSMMNGRILEAKVQRIAQLMLENKAAKTSIGFITRACLILIATMAAVRFDLFDLVSTVIGFMFFPIMIMIVGIISSIRQ